LVKGDTKGKYQAKLKVRGGFIFPGGKIISKVKLEKKKACCIILM